MHGTDTAHGARLLSATPLDGMDSAPGVRLLAASPLGASTSAVHPLPALLARLGMRDAAPDSDGLFSGLLLPSDQHWFLWTTSWVTAVSAVYATSRGLWDLCWCPWIVLCTSLLYWARPTPGARRALDVGCVQLCFWWQLYRAWGAEYGAAYYALQALGVAAYGCSLYFEYRIKWFWVSTLFHGVGVHVVGNASNMVLYSGEIPSLSAHT